MPEPVLYIWLSCEPCTRYSLATFGQSPRHISNSTSYIFNSTFEFLFTLQLSLWGWEMATDWPPPSAFSSSMLCEERESVGNTQLPPQAQLQGLYTIENWVCYPFVLSVSIVWTCFVLLQNCKIPLKKIEKNVNKMTFTKSNTIILFFEFSLYKRSGLYWFNVYAK